MMRDRHRAPWGLRLVARGGRKGSGGAESEECASVHEDLDSMWMVGRVALMIAEPDDLPVASSHRFRMVMAPER
jgi:hypothetical protein